MKFKLSLAVLLLFVGFSYTAAADTLTLTSTSGGSVNGISIYPYNFTANIGGVTSSLPLMCLDFTREISVGETWHVTENVIPTGTSQMDLELRALTLIYYGLSTNYGGVSASDYQFAAWNIFDPGVNGNSGLTPLASQISAIALAAASGSYGLPSDFSYSHYALYTPTSDNTGWTLGEPQRFIGERTTNFHPNNPGLAPTPEPSGLLMLGSGMFGVAGMMYRKVRSA